MDFRKGIIAVIIAVLFALLVFTTIDAFLEPIDYSACYEYDRLWENITEEDKIAQQECYQDQQDVREQQRFIRFVVSAIAGLAAVIIGLSISPATGVGMAISSGILLGGLFTIFVGTMANFDSIGVKLRPLIILVEMILVIVVAYFKLSLPGEKASKKKRK